MQIVFHGSGSASFSEGISELLSGDVQITHLPDVLASEADRRAYAGADVIVGSKYDESFPRPEHLKLFHVPGAGYDAVDLAALPGTAVVCNCFGHEQPIAEYGMAALLMQAVPLADADRQLRQKDWSDRSSVHGELAGKTVGLLGFGRIGKAIAARAKAFEMNVHVANRSAVQLSDIVDRAFGLDALEEFWASADFFVVSLPLTPETTGIVGAEAFAAMREHSVIVNVGRGLTIEEQALFDALKTRRIAGAVIDTWYTYPSPAAPNVFPSTLPFQDLPNVVMTSHMSAWTDGTRRRRQQVIAENIERRMRGATCVNIVRPEN